VIALILIVEDDVVIRGVFKEYLESNHCRVLEAADGAQGFALAEKHRPHLIVMDVMMPSLHGTASTKQIRDVPALARIPILIHSGVPEAKVRQLVQLDEKTRYLQKPVDLERFWRAVTELLPLGGYLP
jgi:CheY-like chemotaxis protein